MTYKRVPGHLYVFKAKDGTVKVGRSNNPAARSKMVGKSVRIAYVSRWIDDSGSAEKSAHGLLALGGDSGVNEWFNVSVRDAVRSVRLALQIADGEQLHLDVKPPAPMILLGFVDKGRVWASAQIGKTDWDEFVSLGRFESSEAMSRTVRQAILSERDRLKRRVEAQAKGDTPKG